MRVEEWAEPLFSSLGYGLYASRFSDMKLDSLAADSCALSAFERSQRRTNDRSEFRMVGK